MVKQEVSNAKRLLISGCSAFPVGVVAGSLATIYHIIINARNNEKKQTKLPENLMRNFQTLENCESPNGYNFKK